MSMSSVPIGGVVTAVTAVTIVLVLLLSCGRVSINPVAPVAPDDPLNTLSWLSSVGAWACRECECAARSCGGGEASARAPIFIPSSSS
jgi:hypothetical protein